MATLLLVRVREQRLCIIRNKRKIRSYRVSTSRFGTGNKEGSQQTPPGLHRIYRKIGGGLRKGAVLKDRCFTGEYWDGQSQFGDLILTRILALEGLEKGVNRGGSVDSRKRFIYIHGTNHEKSVGMPASHGCITMKNSDIIDLYKRVRKGTHVLIG